MRTSCPTTCWLTGQAAGVAAAVALSQGVLPRDVDVAQVQRRLQAQGAYVRDAAQLAEQAD